MGLATIATEHPQGSGIAPPMPVESVAGWVREWRGLFTLAAAAPSAAAAPPVDAATSAPTGTSLAASASATGD